MTGASGLNRLRLELRQWLKLKGVGGTKEERQQCEEMSPSQVVACLTCADAKPHQRLQANTVDIVILDA